MNDDLVTIHDLSTGETIRREMNDDERADFEARKIVWSNKQLVIAEKAQARIDLLAKLGITTEEASLLLGSN